MDGCSFPHASIHPSFLLEPELASQPTRTHAHKGTKLPFSILLRLNYLQEGFLPSITTFLASRAHAIAASSASCATAAPAADSLKPRRSFLGDRMTTKYLARIPFRPGAMKSATSLLLGAALATAFFLLYTSLGRDLGAGNGPPARSPPWNRKVETTTAVVKQEARRPNVEEDEVETEQVAAGGDGTRRTEHPEKQRIVMPAAETNKQTNNPPQQDLADLLRRAATADKTVLMTAINEAWAAPGSFLDLFLESFKHGEGTADLPQHLLVVAMDGKAFERCNAVHSFCYWFRVDGMDFAAEQTFMKGDYLEMMWRRNRFQQTILELGYSFLFTDVDILWFRSPFLRLPVDAQVVMSSDFFVGDPNSPGNYPNGGLLYVRASPATVAFYRHWQASRARFPGKHEQDVFDKIVKEGVPPHVGARVQFLDTAVFGGFCQHGKDLGRVATMHANCCVGLHNKLFDLKNVLEDWKTYRARAAAGNAQGFSWRVPGRCIH